jgi:hypothetical protein
MTDKDEKKPSALAPMQSLQQMLQADKSVVTKDEIFNVIMVEQEHKLKQAMAQKRVEIKEIKELRDGVLIDLNQAVSDLVLSKLPDHTAVHAGLQKLFEVQDQDETEKLFSHLVQVSKTKKAEDVFSSSYACNDTFVDNAIASAIIGEESDKQYLLIKTKYKPLGLIVNGRVKVKVTAPIIRFANQYNTMGEQTDEMVNDITILQRQLQEMPALERAARAKFTALALSATDQGKTILDELRNSPEMKSVLAIAAGQR